MRLVLLLCCMALSAARGRRMTSLSQEQLDLHAFFYLWYGNPQHDGEWRHWNHRVLPHWDAEHEATEQRFAPPDTPASPFRPSRGLYSSADKETLLDQMSSLRHHGIGVIAVSWWGRPEVAHTHDGEGVSTDQAIPAVLQAAEESGIKVCFHLEPYQGRTAESVRRDVEYIVDKYSSSHAFYRDPSRDDRTLFYVYDSYHIDAAEWAQLLDYSQPSTIRGTSYDADFIGLVVSEADVRPGTGHLSHFDGAYSYFGSRGFTWGSSPRNWPALTRWAQGHNKVFVPCVAPGYDDTMIRPWNSRTKYSRDDGQYLEQWWRDIMHLRPVPRLVAVTSYNEWGEGTAIEETQEYGTKYLELTSRLAEEWRHARDSTHRDEL